jgi:sensor histidine kinase YesM
MTDFFTKINYIRILKHLLFWMIFFSSLLLIAGVHTLSGDFWLVDLPILLFYVYFTVYFLLPYFVKKHLYLFLFLGFLLFSLFLSYIRLLNYDFVYYSIFAPEMEQEQAKLDLGQILLNAKDFSFALFIFLAVKSTRSWILWERKKIKSENSQLESRLQLMKAQVDPHFLFNTLNNLYSLSVTEPLKTKNAIRKLWGLVDFIVSETQSNEIEIRKEMKLINDFVELEQLRYGERLSFHASTEKEILSYRIPPLLFFPFVENCFRYLISYDPGNPRVEISIQELEDRIRFIHRISINSLYYDKGKMEEISESFKRMRERLNHILPEKHLLRIDAKEEEHFIQLDILT